MQNLFESVPENQHRKPLAERMRPSTLEEVLGQDHILGRKGFLTTILSSKKIPSLVFWGPPGTGKTTIARIIANYVSYPFVPFSAVTSGIPEIKKLLKEVDTQNQTILLFIDEIHRFNKAQQDAFLPFIENGSIVLVGATTENPSFALNNALLSRLKIVVLHPLEENDIRLIVDRALSDKDKGVHFQNSLPESCIQIIINYASGDARMALNLLELVHYSIGQSTEPISQQDFLSIVQKKIALYDKTGEFHYNFISALHKSLRGSDVDASLYYLVRMLDAGEDPLYIARRLVRFSAEDIGLADPFALVLAQNAFEACHKIGSPECDVILGEIVAYLALAPKSNRIYEAVQSAQKTHQDNPDAQVPMFLRNAPTKLMKEIGYGKGYIYPPHTSSGVVATEYLPPSLRGKEFYTPSEEGKEKQFKQRLEILRKKLHRNENNGF
jgi:putative ATPase